MNVHHRPAQRIKPRVIDKDQDTEFVLSVLRSLSASMKHINSVIETAGIALKSGMISPGAAINMVNGVAPGSYAAFVQDVDAAEIGVLPHEGAK
jgi:hypothetical protein